MQNEVTHNSTIAKGSPGKTQDQKFDVSCHGDLKDWDALIEQSNIILKQSVDPSCALATYQV